MICVSLPARSNDEMLHMMHESAPEADVLELRLDGIAEPDLPRLLAARLRPVIVTNRPAQEGGLYHGSESRRLRLLEQACSLGAEYVDIELAAGAFHGKGAKRIVSFHDFKGMPANLSAVRGKLVEAGADIAKMAVTANDVVDNLAVFHLLQAAAAGADRVATIALCMGEAGLISRLLSPKFGGFLTYAAARLEGKERPAAPGQISARRLREEFRYAKISRSTDIFGVIGNPVAHSLSPAIHNAAYDELALDAVYVPFLVRDVQGFVPAFRALGVKGFSVTIPHKEAALATADEVDDIARRIGAANTLYERGGKLRATNTDCAAAVAALETALGAAGERGSALRNKRAVVVGAGGAARAVVFGLGDRGAAVTIVNRTRERGARLAEEANRTRPGSCRSDGLDALPTLDFDILCNLTSVGMYPDVDATPVPRGILKPQHIVFDAVYNPLETRLLREAREAGCTVVPGLDWFIGQAAAQFLLWTGRPAPHETMRRAAMERLKKDEGR